MKELLASLIVGVYGTPAACILPASEDTGEPYVRVSSERFDGLEWGCDWIGIHQNTLTGSCASEGTEWIERFVFETQEPDKASLTFQDGHTVTLQRCP